MILRSLELKSFGQFIDQNYEFRRGMNLVVGPNEAGKSTMIEAIPAVLFGCKDKKRFRPWARNVHCLATLILENKHSNISITRDIDTDIVDLSLADDLYQEQVHFQESVVVGEHSASKIEYLLHLKKFFGLNDERLFRSSLFVGQGDFPSSASEISTQLRNLLSGFARGDSDIVLKALQDDYLAITNENPWSDKRSSARELEVVQEALGDLHVQQGELQLVMRQLQQLQQQISSIELGLTAERHDYIQGVEYLHWVQQQWHSAQVDPLHVDDVLSAQDQMIDTNNAGALECERLQLEKTLVDANLPVEIPADLPQLLADADDIRGDLIALQQQMLPLHKELKAQGSPHWLRWIILSLVMLILVGAGGYFYPQWQPLGDVVLVIILLVAWCFLVVGARKKYIHRDKLQQQLDKLALLREEDRSRLKTLDDKFEQYGFSASAVEMVKMKKQLEAHGHIFARLSQIRTESSNVDDGQPGNMEQKIVATQSEHLQPQDLPEAEHKLAQLKKMIASHELELMTLQRQEAVLNSKLEGLDNIEIREQQLRQNAADLLKKKAVIGCAHSVLNDAINEFHQTNLRALEKEIGKYLSKITQGKYSAVKIGENYSIRLRQTGQRGRGRALEDLSRGTIDLACLAIRLALTRFLTKDESLPFFLDDALVNLDTTRLYDTVEALEILSAEHQIMLFTHDERVYKLASKRRWHIVSLGQRQLGNVMKKSRKEAEIGGQLSLL